LPATAAEATHSSLHRQRTVPLGAQKKPEFKTELDRTRHVLTTMQKLLAARDASLQGHCIATWAEHTCRLRRGRYIIGRFATRGLAQAFGRWYGAVDSFRAERERALADAEAARRGGAATALQRAYRVRRARRHMWELVQAATHARRALEERGERRLAEAASLAQVRQSTAARGRRLASGRLQREQQRGEEARERARQESAAATIQGALRGRSHRRLLGEMARLTTLNVDGLSREAATSQQLQEERCEHARTREAVAAQQRRAEAAEAALAASVAALARLVPVLEDSADVLEAVEEWPGGGGGWRELRAAGAAAAARAQAAEGAARRAQCVEAARVIQHFLARRRAERTRRRVLQLQAARSAAREEQARAAAATTAAQQVKLTAAARVRRLEEAKCR
jgi:hypothetical protein